ncbi:exodeoxyribonuclease III [bacterium]|nr:exodeoxyribonuclease III [bacterium]
MKICTYNVNSIKSRKELLFSWLNTRENDIDLLCLQELKCTEEHFPFSDFQNRGFHCDVFGQKTYNGVAICSKFPLNHVQKGFGDEHWDQQKRFIAAPAQGFFLINVYAPHGGFKGTDKFFYKREWYEILFHYLHQHYSPEDPVMLVGDCNVAREDKDVFAPQILQDSIGTMPEEREELRKILDWGLVDTFRYLYPEKKQFTWWDYRGGAIWRDEGMRIDYVLCTQPLLERIKDVEVDVWPRRRRSPKPSDHAPLIISLDEE